MFSSFKYQISSFDAVSIMIVIILSSDIFVLMAKLVP